ncbi:MAG: NADH-quinone oxidoreductase subunit A [Anaerolineaceae bacterium]
MMNAWLYIGLFLAIALALPAVAIFISYILGPKKPDPVKRSVYECGIETVGETWVQFKAQYYIFGLVFLVFDVETVFLYPWAAAYNQLTLFMVLEAVLFILILVAGLLYAWRKGALEWV